MYFTELCGCSKIKRISEETTTPQLVSFSGKFSNLLMQYLGNVWFFSVARIFEGTFIWKK